MDFRFSPEEEAFRKEVAAFLEKEVPREYREKRLTFFDMSAQPDWIQVHRRMAEKLGAKGWLSLHWPQEYGGKNLSPFYRLILREELARYHSPGYDSIGCGIVAPAILLKGSRRAKEKAPPRYRLGQGYLVRNLKRTQPRLRPRGDRGLCQRRSRLFRR